MNGDTPESLLFMSLLRSITGEGGPKEDASNVQYFCKEHAPGPVDFQGDLESLVGHYVKKAFSDGECTEHMWVKVEAVEGDAIVGTINNQPSTVKWHMYGQRVTVKRGEIEDVYE